MSPSDPATNAGPPFQFTRRQLFLLMVAVSVPVAFINWFGAPIALLATILGVLLGVVYLLIVRRFTEAAIVFLIGMVIAPLLLPFAFSARDTPRWSYCQNNMRNIALALQQYEFRNGTLPPAYIA